jgi:hypothetical protein
MVGTGTAASASDQPRDWGRGTVVDVFPPERQPRKDAKSPHPVAYIHQRNPYPVFTAPGANTRWVFVIRSGEASHVVSIRVLAGNSPLRNLQPGDAVEVAKPDKRTMYIRVPGKQYEKLRVIKDLP